MREGFRRIGVFLGVLGLIGWGFVTVLILSDVNTTRKNYMSRTQVELLKLERDKARIGSDLAMITFSDEEIDKAALQATQPSKNTITFSDDEIDAAVEQVTDDMQQRERVRQDYQARLVEINVDISRLSDRGYGFFWTLWQFKWHFFGIPFGGALSFGIPYFLMLTLAWIVDGFQKKGDQQH